MVFNVFRNVYLKDARNRLKQQQNQILAKPNATIKDLVKILDFDESLTVFDCIFKTSRPNMSSIDDLSVTGIDTSKFGA